ncbi:hypothetical protein CLM85_12265 [Streptomyces albidoflavus]|nr:hypothetical protein CLM85_12265 [Streptomyces albidoflavus]
MHCDDRRVATDIATEVAGRGNPDGVAVVCALYGAMTFHGPALAAAAPPPPGRGPGTRSVRGRAVPRRVAVSGAGCATAGVRVAVAVGSVARVGAGRAGGRRRPAAGRRGSPVVRCARGRVRVRVVCGGRGAAPRDVVVVVVRRGGGPRPGQHAVWLEGARRERGPQQHGGRGRVAGGQVDDVHGSTVGAAAGPLPQVGTG